LGTGIGEVDSKARFTNGGGRGAKPLLDESEKQRIIAMVCSQPPSGYARWTVRLVAEQVVKRKLVPRVGRETIRILLLSHDLKPWREKNVVRGGAEPGVC
jgi:Homeodomain-like domain